MATCRFCGVRDIHEVPLEVIFYCTASLQLQRPSSLVDLRCLSPPDPVFLTSFVHVVSQFPHSLPYQRMNYCMYQQQLHLQQRSPISSVFPGVASRLPHGLDSHSRWIPITMQEKKRNSPS